MLYIKKNLKICFYICVLWCLLLNFIPLAVSSPSENIHYIKNGWIKEKSIGLIGNYTVQEFKTISNDEIEIKLKRLEGVEENNNKNYDLRNIPCKLLYGSGYNVTNQDYNWSIIEEKNFNLKTKEEDILYFKNINSYDFSRLKVQIGFGTVTFSAVSNLISVNGGSYTIDDIYNADVLGGWGVVNKIDTNVFNISSKIIVGNVNSTTLKIFNKTVIFNFNIGAGVNVIQIGSNGILLCNESQIIYQKKYNGWDRILYNDGFVEIQNSLLKLDLDGGRYDCWLRDNNIGYLNNSKLVSIVAYSTWEGFSNNLAFSNDYYAFESFSAPIDDVYLKSSYLYGYRVSIVDNITVNNMIFDCENSDIRVYQHDSGKWLNLIDCIFTDDELKIYFGAFDGYVWRSNTFNLQTNPYSEITLYNCSGDIVYNGVSDINGLISEQIILVSNHSGNTETTTDYVAETPFRLVIEKSGYQTYNATFNNSFEPMNYKISLMEGEVLDMEISLTYVVMQIIITLLGFYMVHKINQKYVGIHWLPSLVPMFSLFFLWESIYAELGSATSFINVFILLGVVNILFAFYKDVAGYMDV